MKIRNLKPALAMVQERLFPKDEPFLFDAPKPLYQEDLDRSKYKYESRIPLDSMPRLKALFERNDEIAEILHKQKPGKEGGGQIVCIESLKHVDLRSGEAALSEAVFVLLDKPKFGMTDTDSPELYKLMSGVWQGWIVAPDLDYMNEWDVRLNDDELREGDCQFVQTWNRVEIYIPTVHRVAGNISDSLLSNIRYMSVQFATGNNEATSPAITAVGELVQRKLPYGWVQTGTLLKESDDKDPRNYYVSLYSQFEALFSEAVWSMLADAKSELLVLVPAPGEPPQPPEPSWTSRFMNLVHGKSGTSSKSGSSILRPSVSVAFAVIVGVALVLPLRHMYQDESNVERGGSVSQVVITKNLPESINKLKAELDALNITYTLTTKGTSTIIVVNSIDPGRRDVMAFLMRNKLAIPSHKKMIIEIRPQ